MFANPHTLGIFPWGQVYVGAFVVDGQLHDVAIDINEPYRVDDILKGRIAHKDAHFFWVNVGLKEPLPLKRRRQAYHVGDSLLVQITRLPMVDDAAASGYKNIKLTDNIHLFGRLCAYHPLKDGFYAAPEIPPSALTPTLQALAHVTLRHTLAEPHGEADVLKEVNALKAVYNRLKQADTLGLVHQALTPLERLIRDAPAQTDIICETPAVAARYTQSIQALRPDLTARKSIAKINEQPLIRFLGIEEAWHSLLAARVECPKGVSIHFHETPVATLIDVNSGPLKASEANLIAAESIMAHIAWRHLGGPLIIDFVSDMMPSERKALEQALRRHREHLELYPLHLLGWTPLGFFEMNGPKRQESIPTLIRRYSGVEGAL